MPDNVVDGSPNGSPAEISPAEKPKTRKRSNATTRRPAPEAPAPDAPAKAQARPDDEPSPLAAMLDELGISESAIAGMGDAPEEAEPAAPKIWTATDRAAARSGNALELTLADGASITLAQLLAAVLPDVELPPELPDIALSDVSISGSPQAGTFAISGASRVAVALPLGLDGLAVNETSFSLSKAISEATGQPAYSCSVTVRSELPVSVAEGVRFNALEFGFSLEEETDWTLEGSIAATILDADYTLAASLEIGEDSRTITLTASREGERPLLELGDALSLNVSAIEISLTRAEAADEPADPAAPPAEPAEAPTASYAFSLKGSGELNLNLLEPYRLAGSLGLIHDDENTMLAFVVSEGAIPIPLPIPERDIRLHIGLEHIAIRRRAGAAGASWGVDTAISAALTGLPPAIQAALAEKTVGRLQISDGGVELSVDRILRPLEIALPPGRFDEVTVELGTAALDASNLSLRIDGDALALTMDFGLGLPSKLNGVFGTRDDGTPLMDLFTVYAADDPDSLIKLRLGIDSAAGVIVQPLTSPIAAINFEVEGLETWCVADFGEFGGLKFMVPTFSFDGYMFTARGGFEQTRPLALPLKPIKQMLRAAEAGDLANILPDRLALSDLNVVGEDGELRVGELVEILRAVTGVTLPSEITALLEGIKGQFEQLPLAFRSYLRFVLPDSFAFDISLSVDGSAKIKISTSGEPIRWLIPNGPMFLGVELHSFTFGEVFSGALFLLTADVRLDMFDFPTLLTALLPNTTLRGLPDPRTLYNRLTIKDLLLFIVYQTQVPIPVPVFYDELSYKYLGLSGVELGTHWHFPQPRPNLTEALGIVSDLSRFFTKADYLLDTSNTPRKMDFRYTIGANYIQLPEYLGGALLGKKTNLLELSAYRSIAFMLNALKTLSLNELIQAIPIEERVGQERIQLAGLGLDAAWLITTPEEFRTVGYTHLRLEQSGIAQTLEVLPPNPARDDRGLVVLLTGGLNLFNQATLETWVGLAASDGGFATGLRARGAISGVLDADLQGVFIINTDPAVSEGVTMTGRSHLRLGEDTIFQGNLKLGSSGFAISGALNLFPRVPGLTVSGALAGRITQDEFALAGSVTVALGAHWTLLDASAEITQRDIALRGRWLNQEVLFTLRRDPDGGVSLAATLAPIDLAGVLTVRGANGAPQPLAYLRARPNQLPELYLSGAVSLLGVSAEAEVRFAETGFGLMVQGKLFDLFAARLEASGPSLLDESTFRIRGSLQNDLWRYLGEHASAWINETAGAATRQISEWQYRVGQEQANVDSLLIQIEQARQAVRAEREWHQARLREAEAAVQGEQAKINDLSAQINAMRQTVQAERDRDQARLRDAEWAVQNEQGKVDSLLGQIDEMRRIVGAEHERDQARLRDAEWAVQNEQNKVNGLLAEMERVRGVIAGERQVAVDRMNAAQADLDRAQAEVNKIQDEINSTNNWYYSLPKIDWPWNANQTREAGWFATKQAALYTALGVATGVLQGCRGVLEGIKQGANFSPPELDPRLSSLITAHAIATAALQTAALGLQGIRETIKLVPVDADPRVSALLVAHGTATLALQGAQFTVQTIRDGLQLIPVDADPRIVALFGLQTAAGAALEVATKALQTLQAGIAVVPIDVDPRVAPLIVAHQAGTEALKLVINGLESAKQAVGFAAGVATFIAQRGLGGVLSVSGARFDTTLAAAKHGRITLELDLVFMDQAQTRQIEFNFLDPIGSARSLGQALLPG